MMDIINHATPLAAWFWLVAGLALCAAEMLVPGAYLLWIGLAALALGVIKSILSLDMNITLLAFAGLSIASSLLGSRFYGAAPKNTPNQSLNQGAASLVGQEFVLERAIHNGAGHIRVRDSIWRVSGPDCDKGARVKVVDVEDGVLLKVVRVEQG